MTSKGDASGSRRASAGSIVWAIAASLVLGVAGVGFTAVASPTKVARPAAMPVISRNVPAYTNDDCTGAAPAGQANDGSYDTQWHACNTPSSVFPIYLAYDLSGVASTARGRVIVAWYNDPTTVPYDHTYISSSLCCGGPGNDIPMAYTLEANAAPGGNLPTSGWVELARVSGNVYHSRQHLIDLTGYSWLRMNVTGSDGWALNLGVRLNLDVHDAAAGPEDDWVFFGDSITEAGMAHNSLSSYGGRGTWAQLINATAAGYFPAFEDGAIGGTHSADGAKNMNTWLAMFPGMFVGLAYGTNDAALNVSPTVFYDNYVTMVEAVLAAGKIPVIPKIPWGCNGSLQTNGPALNQQIERLYSTYPVIVHGPDLWSYFQANPSLISSDCVHPTGQGFAALRQQWANAMLTNVYHLSAGGTTPAPTPQPMPSPALPLPTLPPLL